ncbi:MAG TPA: DUF2752 domain-containing protein [Planctomycetes bacterium]|nr:DUF2752 domain-containing protein [Planctomycetota bacterium]
MTSATDRAASSNNGDLTVIRLVCGSLSILLLACARWFTPNQIAAGEHLSWTGLVPGTCPGCPLCGLSRGFSFAMRADFTAASNLNLAFWPIFLAVVVGASQAPLAIRTLYLKS